jgi:hypothetical protein
MCYTFPGRSLKLQGPGTHVFEGDIVALVLYLYGPNHIPKVPQGAPTPQNSFPVRP